MYATSVKRLLNYVVHLNIKQVNRMARNVLLDMKYGGFAGGRKESPYRNLGAVNTVSTDYDALPYIFRSVTISKRDVIVDVGSGRGRVINWLLNEGIDNKIIGIELDEEIAEKTRKRLRKYGNVTIVAGDALENIPEEANIFYLYNPFDGFVMEKFKNRLFDIFGSKRNITILYYNCAYRNIFESDPNWYVEILDIGKSFHESCIIRMCPASRGVIVKCCVWH